jgi:hypothetical protein
MKRLLSTVLALTLLSGTAAYADPHGYGRGNGGYEHSDGYRGERHWDRRHGDNDGAAFAAGVGILALFAVMASQNQNRDDYDRDDARYQRDQYYGNGDYNNRGYDNGGTYGDGGGYGNDGGYDGR